MKYLALVLSLFVAACSNGNNKVPQSTKKSEANSIVPDWVFGKWQYQDHQGKDVEVTIYADGSALGSDQQIGSWFFVDNYLHIVWMNGWQDLIKKATAYKKFGYAPGVATSDFPTNESEAKKVE